jgi:LuxR family transcriptional regulator, maltose regulon positive regulatory protein
VLRTKLTIPQLWPGALPRSALTDYLTAAGVPGRLILVVAGAGWGKSTLLAQWHDQDPHPERFGWLSLESGDNDPTRFWVYALAALAPLGEGLSRVSARLLSAPGTSPVDDVVPALINELTVVGDPVTLVLDDYHLISNDEVHAAMAVLVEHLPRTLRLVISSRTCPPLPVVRLRGRGELVDISSEDLRLSVEESKELIEQELPGTLGAEGLALLCERTEGWVTGLHLAALSLRGHPDPERLVQEFAGDDRHIGAYLLTEVLQQQPAEVRSFLRATSILTQFSAALCDAVTARDDSAEVVEPH